MVDSENFSALRVRGRLEDIARTIAEARVTGDVYGSLDTVEHALLAVMDEVAEIAQAVDDVRRRDRPGTGAFGGFGTWMRRLTSPRFHDRP